MGDTADAFPSTIYHSYLVLVLYVWRAVLRTTVCDSDPPQVIDANDTPETTGTFRDFQWSFDFLAEMYPSAGSSGHGHGTGDQDAVVAELYEAALSCATVILDFVSGLGYKAFSQFWYSCK